MVAFYLIIIVHYLIHDYVRVREYLAAFIFLSTTATLKFRNNTISWTMYADR